MMIIAFLIAFKMAFSRSKQALASFVVVTIGAMASSGSIEMRPHVFSFLFFALTVLILRRYYERGDRSIFLLLPLFILWANFHGGVIVGLAYVLFEAFLSLISPPDWAQGRRYPRLAAASPLAGIFAAGVLIALVNPNGIWVYKYPIMIMTHSGSKGISEWASPDFHNPLGRWLLVFFGLAAVSGALFPKSATFRDVAYVLCFAAATLVSRRYVAFFVIACAGPIALWLSSSFNQAESWLARRRKEKVVQAATWTILAIFAITLIIDKVSDVHGKPMFDYMASIDVFPSDACDFITSHNIKGPMLNDINYGGYLIYRLWPKHKVFVDTRQEPFIGGAWEEAVSAIYCTHPGAWQHVFDKHKINFAILNPITPLTSVLAEQPNWVLVYRDNRAMVFVRNTPENSSVIEASRYGI
jgi:hypothetical protein